MRHIPFTPKIKSALLLLTAFGVLFNSSALVAALTQKQRDLYQSGVRYYDRETCKIRPGGGGSGGGGGAGSASPTANIQEFVDQYGQAAFNVGKQFGIPYEAILAQAALESGYGRSGLTREANNFFGIKAGSSWTGPVYSAQTQEVGPGGSYTTTADFRAYPNPEAGFRGYGEFITQNSRYAQALQHPGDPVAYITEIKNAGYATDPEYVSKVTNLINEVTSYVSANDLFPPSSEVEFDREPPAPSTGGGGGGGGGSSGGGGGAFDCTEEN